MAAHVQIIKLIRGGLHLQYNSTYSPAGRTETNHAKQSANISVSDPDPDRSGFFFASASEFCKTGSRFGQGDPGAKHWLI